MYTADVDGKRHTFQASGSLWQDALVMQDVESKSLWAQITGESIQGEKEGKQLSLFNFSHSTFAEFKKQYPNGVLLSKQAKGEAGSHYKKYFADSTKFGIFDRADTFTKLGGKEIVYGLRLPCKDIALSKKYLIDKGYYAFECEGSVIVVNFDKESETINGYKTNFKMNGGKILNSWNNDELKIFEQVPVLTSFWFAWISFFPETELIQ